MKGLQKLILIVIIILLICAGLFFAVKPTLDNQQNLQKQEEILKAIESGNEAIEVMLQTDDDVDIYDSFITPLPSANLLNTVKGIGIITIEIIDLRLPVVEGVENSKLKVALGHVPDTADISEVGNCIIAGHRNYTCGEMFNRLNEVDIGDIIKLTTIAGKTYDYKVYALTVIKPGDDSLFQFGEGQKKLTLLTCTPVRKATHRLLVQAELIE